MSAGEIGGEMGIDEIRIDREVGRGEVGKGEARSGLGGEMKSKGQQDFELLDKKRQTKHRMDITICVIK